MKLITALFGVYITFGLTHDYISQAQDERADLYTTNCFDIPDLTCGIEIKRTADPYLDEKYNSSTIYIEKTFTLSE